MKSLLVVHTNLVAFLTPGTASTFSFLSKCVALYTSTPLPATLCLRCRAHCRDKMGVSLYPHSQREYFNLLSDWAAGAIGTTGAMLAPDRKLALLSGDMHFAMRTDILR